MPQVAKTQHFMQTIHQNNDTSYITIAVAPPHKKSWTQFHYKGVKPATNKVLEYVGQDMNVYHSNNSFYKPERGHATLFNINTLYIDLDCHDHSDIDYNRALEFLKTLFYEVKIPTPTYTVMSGRGFHLYWTIDTAPKQAVFLWKLLQTRLAEELSRITEFVPELKVDESSVHDVARVFRVVGTTNTKANKIATIVDQCDVRYSMDHMRDKYFPDMKPKKKNTKTKAKTITNGNITTIYNTLSLQQARITDLEKLIELRHGDLKGCRDEFLFIYGWTVVARRSSEELFIRELQAVNTLFKEPLKTQEIEYKARHIYKKHKSKALKKAEPKHYYENFDVYIFRNDTIIKRLEITDSEQKHMITLIAKREKYDRNNVKRNQARRNDNGLTKRQQAKEDLATQIKDLKDKGLKQKQIAETLGISLDTVKYYGRKIKKV